VKQLEYYREESGLPLHKMVFCRKRDPLSELSRDEQANFQGEYEL